jgi:hypothetical protein
LARRVAASGGPSSCSSSSLLGVTGELSSSCSTPGDGATAAAAAADDDDDDDDADKEEDVLGAPMVDAATASSPMLPASAFSLCDPPNLRARLAAMMSRLLRCVADAPSDAAAFDSLIRMRSENPVGQMTNSQQAPKKRKEEAIEFFLQVIAETIQPFAFL